MIQTFRHKEFGSYVPVSCIFFLKDAGLEQDSFNKYKLQAVVRLVGWTSVLSDTKIQVYGKKLSYFLDEIKSASLSDYLCFLSESDMENMLQGEYPCEVSDALTITNLSKPFVFDLICKEGEIYCHLVSLSGNKQLSESTHVSS